MKEKLKATAQTFIIYSFCIFHMTWTKVFSNIFSFVMIALYCYTSHTFQYYPHEFLNTDVSILDMFRTIINSLLIFLSHTIKILTGALLCHSRHFLISNNSSEKLFPSFKLNSSSPSPFLCSVPEILRTWIVNLIDRVTKKSLIA